MTMLAPISAGILIILALAGFGVTMYRRKVASALVVLAVIPFVIGFTLNALGLQSWMNYNDGLGEGAWGNFYPVVYMAPFYLGFLLLVAAASLTLSARYKHRIDRAALAPHEAAIGQRSSRGLGSMESVDTPRT